MRHSCRRRWPRCCWRSQIEQHSEYHFGPQSSSKHKRYGQTRWMRHRSHTGNSGVKTRTDKSILSGSPRDRWSMFLVSHALGCATRAVFICSWPARQNRLNPFGAISAVRRLEFKSTVDRSSFSANRSFEQSLCWQSISPTCRIDEKVRLFIARVARAQTFERVPHDAVAIIAFIDWKIAFKHCSLRTERLDASFDKRPPRICELLRRGRNWPYLEIEAEHLHAHAAELDAGVGALAELA
jgi:hypothetical protein